MAILKKSALQKSRHTMIKLMFRLRKQIRLWQHRGQSMKKMLVRFSVPVQN